MSTYYNGFQNDFEYWLSDVYRCALLLVPDKAQAEYITLHAFLCLATTKTDISTRDSQKIFLFRELYSFTQDYYYKKMRKSPKLLNDNPLKPLYRLSFKKRFYFYLKDFLFCSNKEINACLGHSLFNVFPTKTSFSSDETKLLVQALQELPISMHLQDSILASIDSRFLDRSVGFENKIWNVFHFIDRMLPYIAIIIVLFVSYCIWFSANYTL